MTQETVLPRELEERIADFLRAAKTGSIELHVTCGTIATWKVIETGRIVRR